MKKTLFIFLWLLTISAIVAQNEQFVSTIPSNKKVVLEEFTGVYCQYCPDGHHIANQIAANHPDSVFPINIHVGSFASNTYTTQFGDALANQSGLTGYPSGTINRHVFTGGVTALNRGDWSNCASAILNQSSPVNIAAHGTLNWLNRELNITVQLYYTSSEQNATNRLNVAILQNNIIGDQVGASLNPSQVVGNQYRHMHMLRHFITGQWGDTVNSTSAGSFVEKTYSYTIPETLGSPNAVLAKLEDLEFIAFVTQGHQEILSACKVDIENLNIPSINFHLESLYYNEIHDCTNDAKVDVLLRNVGVDSITSLTFEYSIGNGNTQTYNWTGYIPSMSQDTIELPVFSLIPNIEQTIIVKTTSVNGSAHESNQISLSAKKIVTTGTSIMTLKIKTDQYSGGSSGEQSYKLYNSNNEVIQQANSSQFTNNSVNSFPINITTLDCYRLEVNDTYGDGIGGGYVQLLDVYNNIILNIPGNSFAFSTNAMVDVNTIYYDVSVSTLPATELTATSVKLSGTASLGGATISNMGFQYRALGDSTYISVSASGTSDYFYQSLYNLPVSTEYEYRAFVNIAENTETYYGTTQTFEMSWLNEDTIYVYDANMLEWVADQCNSSVSFEGKYIKLMNNIVLPLNQPNNMTSIGSYPNHPFKGTFDGNGKLITNLYIDHPNTEYQGFFGYTLGANLYEVGLVNITASGRNYTGGMVAYASNTYMRDCYVNGGTLFALSYCGGLVGYQAGGTNSIISGCYNTCTVSGNHYVGGLVGFSNYATVRNSYVAASVTGQGNGIGAIIGGANEVLMYLCYFNDSITGQTSAIGENNFKDNEGMTTAQMQDPAFVATLNQGLVMPVWKSDYSVPINNGFPILMWQYSNVESCEAPTNLNAVVYGSSATLSWDGGDDVSYFIVEYGLIGGETHSENTANHQLTLHDLQNTNYFWRVKSVCSFGESNFVNGSTITVGLDDHDGFDFKVYPNPTSNIVNVECIMKNEEWSNVELYLCDAYGRLLDVVRANNHSPLQTAQIDLSGYANGIYFVKAVANGKTVAVRKVVKQ